MHDYSLCITEEVIQLFSQESILANILLYEWKIERTIEILRIKVNNDVHLRTVTRGPERKENGGRTERKREQKRN